MSQRPAVGPDGTIYVETTSPDDTTKAVLTALHPDGTVKWKNEFANQFLLSSFIPSVGPEGNVYVIGNLEDGLSLVSFAPDGTINWTNQVGVFPSQQSIDSTGTSYSIVGPFQGFEFSDTSTVHAINSQGQTKWTKSFTGVHTGSPPIISPDNQTIYLALIETGGEENPNIPKVIALTREGTVKWTKKFPDYPTIGLGMIWKDETIPVLSPFGVVTLKGEDGSVIWSHKDNPPSLPQPIPESEGAGATLLKDSILVHLAPGFLVEFSKSNGEILSFETYEPSNLSLEQLEVPRFMARGDDGRLFLPFESGHVLALDSEKNVLWERSFEKNAESRIVGPLLTDDGSLLQYMGNQFDEGTETFYSIETESNGLASEVWPSFAHDNQNTWQAGNVGRSCELKPKLKLVPRFIFPNFGFSTLFITGFEDSDVSHTDVKPSTVTLANAEAKRWWSVRPFTMLKFTNRDLEYEREDGKWFSTATLTVEGELKDGDCFKTEKEVFVWG